jgi:hypothetical protein
MEELSVRADIALSQKKAIHDIVVGAEEEDEDFEKEYMALSAQVVSKSPVRCVDNVPCYQSCRSRIVVFFCHRIRLYSNSLRQR